MVCVTSSDMQVGGHAGMCMTSYDIAGWSSLRTPHVQVFFYTALALGPYVYMLHAERCKNTSTKVADYERTVWIVSDIEMHTYIHAIRQQRNAMFCSSYREREGTLMPGYSIIFHGNNGTTSISRNASRRMAVCDTSLSCSCSACRLLARSLAR